jgi:hypothetical protein
MSVFADADADDLEPALPVSGVKEPSQRTPRSRLGCGLQPHAELGVRE